jgi:hypothetical protein
VAETTVKKTSMLRVSTHWLSDGTSVPISVEDMPEINVFLRFEYYMLYILYLFVTYVLIVPHTYSIILTVLKYVLIVS